MLPCRPVDYKKTSCCPHQADNGGGGGGVDGGSRCRMSIIRKGYVALSIIRQTSCCPVDYKKTSCRPVKIKKTSFRLVAFKKTSYRMSLRPKKGHVAVAILGVYTHYNAILNHLTKKGEILHRLNHLNNKTASF